MVTIASLPKFGEVMEDARIVEWYKKEGDRVEKGQPLFMIETEKFTIEVEATASGVLRKILSHEGSIVPVGGPVGIIAEPNEELPDLETLITPQVTAPSVAVAKVEKPEVTPRERLKISPLARKVAEEQGIDITTLVGTGPGGRIVKEDVLRTIEQARAVSVVTPTMVEEKVIPMTGMRKTIAERLSYSARTAAHVTITTEVDMTEIKQFREKTLSEIKDTGIRTSFTDLIVKAVAKALKEYPIFNSTLEADHIKIWKNINIGVAVAVQEGLIVPVIHDADKKSILEIAACSKDLIEKARRGGVMPDETVGGTFTITNLGMYGVDVFTPIINPPQSAILGIGRIVDKPVIINGQILARSVTNLSLSFDHRIVDGSLGAQFLQKIRQILEKPPLLIEQERS